MIYLGNGEIQNIYLGNSPIQGIYAGDLLIYPTTVTGWSVNPASFEVKSSSGSVTIRITSLSAWTITSSESWITFSQNSGDSGRTTVIAAYEENVGDSDRTATITASDGTNVTTISFLQSKYAALPAKAFLCNYNAKQYISSSRTFPMAEEQTVRKNLVLYSSTVTAHTDSGYCSISNNQCIFNFNTAANNPFNRYNTTTGRSLTIVYKTSSFSNNLFANRGYRSGSTGDYYNYMVRDTIFHTSDSNFLRMTASTSPYIMYVRINEDGTSERKCVTTGQIVTASSVSYGNAPSSCAFFKGFGGGSLAENYSGNFYWIYISTEVLTDAEIQQVIDYNEEL
jgi:hypothetical protein